MYPEEFLGIVKRPDNICIQFQDVKATNRIAYKDASDLPKYSDPALYHSLPISPKGTKVNIVATRLSHTNLIKLQRELLSVYQQYVLEDNNPDMIHLVRQIRDRCDNILICHTVRK